MRSGRAWTQSKLPGLPALADSLELLLEIAPDAIVVVDGEGEIVAVNERAEAYEITEGWEPLCEFLEVPVPDAPMPHLNDATSFRAMVGLPALPA